MEEKEYKIVMYTPIGLRHGRITLASMKDRLNGTLHILGHSEPFTGTVDSDGKCEFCGNIVTLTRTIVYTAVGTIHPQSIELHLQGGCNRFKITGKVIEESEESIS